MLRCRMLRLVLLLALLLGTGAATRVFAFDDPPANPVSPAPTLIPPPANAQLRADLEAAMQAIVPNGSAELIALDGALVARYRASAPRVAASTITLSLLLELLRAAEAGNVDL